MIKITTFSEFCFVSAFVLFCVLCICGAYLQLKQKFFGVGIKSLSSQLEGSDKKLGVIMMFVAAAIGIFFVCGLCSFPFGF
jgi:hypothetical protein